MTSYLSLLLLILCLINMPANVKTTHVARRYFVCFPLPLLLFIYLPLLRSRSIVKEDPEADLSEAESSLYLPGSMDEELFADLPTASCAAAGIGDCRHVYALNNDTLWRGERDAHCYSHPCSSASEFPASQQISSTVTGLHTRMYARISIITENELNSISISSQKNVE